MRAEKHDIASGRLRARFNLDDALHAGQLWGANCGPGAIAAITGLTLAELRPHMGDFECKRYTNPTLMWRVLKKLGVKYRCTLVDQSSESQGWLAFPEYGLARVQWEGPWTAPGVPIAARYRHTHWVGSASNGADHASPAWEELYVFDINAICAGGWIPYSEWAGSLVPWLLKQCEPKSSGRWHITHAVHIDRANKPAEAEA